MNHLQNSSTNATRVQWSCLESEADNYIGGTFVILLIISVTSGSLIFIVLLTVREAKKLKKRVLCDSKKQYEERRRISFHQHQYEEDSTATQKDLENMYEKISPEYLNTSIVSNVNETLDREGKEEEAKIVPRTGSNEESNAEYLLIRQLFHPKEEDQPDQAPLQIKRTSRREKFKSRMRRYTADFLESDISASKSGSMRMRSSVSSSTIQEDEKVLSLYMTQSQRRRRALVFSTRLSFSDDTYTTVV